MLLSKNEYLYLKYSIINRIFMENRETICRKFLKDPSIDPKDGHRLQRGKGPYMKYVKLCQNLGFDREVDLLDAGNQWSPKRTTNKSHIASQTPRALGVENQKQQSPRISPIKTD